MKQVTRRDFLGDFLTGAAGAALAGMGLPAKAATTTAGGVRVTLAKAGQARASIVVLPGAAVAAKHGAEELQKFLAQMSGTKLPILTDLPAGRAGTLITIGNGPLREEEYRVRTRPGRVEIVGGGKRGAMYGCYALLEDALGCRWFTRTVSKVPKRATITVGPLALTGKPAFEYREPYYWEAFDRDWAARNKTNGNGQNLDESVGGRVEYGKFVHTFNELVPPEQYFDAHPEYFSLIDGKRRKGYYQLCLTNPDVLQIAIARVRQWIKDYPTATLFSVSQNDTGGRCECDNCKAVEAEEGAPSGVVLRFVNGVADAISPDNPHILIDTLAYQWTEDPPRHVRPRPNVRVRLAPIGACVGHAFDACDNNAHPYNNLKAWAGITDQLYMWHYCTNFAHYLQPLPDLPEIAADIPLVHKNGVVGLFYEGDYAPGGGGEMAELKAYLMAKLMWDPSRAAPPIINEFLIAVYGPAAPYLGRWLTLLESGLKAPGVHAHIYDPPTAPYLSDALLAQGTALFDTAERVAASDPAALDQVRRARLALEYVQWERLPAGDSTRRALADRIAAKFKQYGLTQSHEGEPAGEFLKRLAG